MKKLLLILLLSSPCLAGQKYNFKDPLLNDEINNIYKELATVLKGNVRISSVTISSPTFKTAVSSLTVNNFSITGTYAGIALGKLIQKTNCTGTTSTSLTSATFTSTVVTCSITPKSASDSIAVYAMFMSYVPIAATAGDYYIARGTTKLGSGNAFAQQGDSGVTFTTGVVFLGWIDAPATTSNTTYTVYGSNESGTGTVTIGNNRDWNIILEEYQP